MITPDSHVHPLAALESGVSTGSNAMVFPGLKTNPDN
jgi:hypothetical protein